MSTFYIFLALLFLTGTTKAERNCFLVDSETIQCNYVPANISETISRVKIVDFIHHNDCIEIDSSYFAAEGWRHVTYLEISNFEKYENAVNFTAETFSPMKMLNELSINLPNVNLSPDTFISLDSVRTLNVKDCFRLSLNDLLHTLNGTDKLRGLNRLIMSRLNEYHPPNIIDERFGYILQQKKLTYLDMSCTEITELHLDVLKYLGYLRYLNVSGATIGKSFKLNFNVSYLKNVDLDVSHAILPQNVRPPPGKFVISNAQLKTSSFKSFAYTYFAQANTYNVSSIILHFTTIWLNNVTLIVDKPIIVLLRRLICKNNNLKWFDLKIDFSKPWAATALEEVDISHNGMQFVNPIGRKFAPNLKIINLSFNQLHEMSKNNLTLFESLFHSLLRLQVISLSNNGLITIPVNIFKDNFDLKTIDLSENNLEQVTFSLSHLRKLELLDLQGNVIHILSQESLYRLNSIPQVRRQDISVLLNNNPISCSECKARDFIQWLITSDLINVQFKYLTCKAENGHLSSVNYQTLKNVQGICDRVKTIIISCVSGLVAIATIILVVVLTIRYRRRQSILKKRRRVVQMLENGRQQYEFAVFLVYNIYDEDFVHTHVLTKLNKHLQNTTGIDRDMVCTEDRFRPGTCILNEVYNCFQRVSVIVAVVSDHFYRDDSFCRFELDLACRLGKPVVLMFKECIDGRITPGPVRHLYSAEASIQWTVENGQYMLQNTWENVARSILDLIDPQN